MANRMTKKKFLEVFEAAGFDFDVWGWEGILNMISCHESYSADLAERDGFLAAAKGNRERADYIFDVLKDLGYYDK